MTIRLHPVTLREANEFVKKWHRHHDEVVGHRVSVGVVDDSGELRGVAIVGRPNARKINHHSVAQATRVCTDGAKNACTKLYSACAQLAKFLGYKRIITYILKSETGISLKAAGWTRDEEVESKGGSWSRPSRARHDKHPLEEKVRWYKELT